MKKASYTNLITSLEFFLNPEVFGDRAQRDCISEHLANGDLVVIKTATEEAFAQKAYDALDQFSDWQVFEGYEKHFHFRHHNIYDENLLPPDLNLCREVFRSAPTKDFIQDLSRKDCQGDTVFTASLYLPGDHSLPHSDFLGHRGAYRQVAFVWYLTKDWQENWGGDFFWCRKSRFISPNYNTLILFTVSPDNMHFVTPVSPYARSKRMALSGWWTSKVESNFEPIPVVESEHGLVHLV
jgi:hypothetical protein